MNSNGVLTGFMASDTMRHPLASHGYSCGLRIRRGRSAPLFVYIVRSSVPCPRPKFACLLLLICRGNQTLCVCRILKMSSSVGCMQNCSPTPIVISLRKCWPTQRHIRRLSREPCGIGQDIPLLSSWRPMWSLLFAIATSTMVAIRPNRCTLHDSLHDSRTWKVSKGHA